MKTSYKKTDILLIAALLSLLNLTILLRTQIHAAYTKTYDIVLLSICTLGLLALIVFKLMKK